MAPSNLRALGAAHNLGGGARQVCHDRDAKGARLPDVRGAVAGLHQQRASTELPRRRNVAQAIAHPAAPGEIQAQGGLSLAE
jgi:hypothetical protein